MTIQIKGKVTFITDTEDKNGHEKVLIEWEGVEKHQNGAEEWDGEDAHGEILIAGWARLHKLEKPMRVLVVIEEATDDER